MSVKSSPFGYSIFDFLTRIIPGLVVATPFAIGFVTLAPRVSIGYQPLLIGLAIFGLIMGELVDILRSSVFRVPLPFKQILYHHTGDEETLSRFDQYELKIQEAMPERLKHRYLSAEVGRGTVFDKSEEDFQEVYESQFGLKFDETSASLLYSTLLSYMDMRMSTETRRYYIIRIFAQNLMFAALFTALISLVAVLVNFGDSDIIFIVVASISLLVGVFQFGTLFSPVAYSFVDRLVIDYYVDRLK